MDIRWGYGGGGNTDIETSRKLVNEKLSSLMNKVIIMATWDGVEKGQNFKTPDNSFYELVNLCSSPENPTHDLVDVPMFQQKRLATVGATVGDNSQIEINNNKNNITLVVPSWDLMDDNLDASGIRASGSQMICMNYKNPSNSKMNDYINFFKKNSFKLKPCILRAKKTTINVPKCKSRLSIDKINALG